MKDLEGAFLSLFRHFSEAKTTTNTESSHISNGYTFLFLIAKRVEKLFSAGWAFARRIRHFKDNSSSFLTQNCKINTLLHVHCYI